MMTLVIPNKIHSKKHARNHERIQKKWLKCFGAARIVLSAPATPVTIAEAPPALGRRARNAVSAARAATDWNEASLKVANEAKLIRLCERLMDQANAGGWSRVAFNIADLAEKEFIKRYMDQHYPVVPIRYYIDGVEV